MQTEEAFTDVLPPALGGEEIVEESWEVLQAKERELERFKSIYLTPQGWAVLEEVNKLRKMKTNSRDQDSDSGDELVIADVTAPLKLYDYPDYHNPSMESSTGIICGDNHVPFQSENHVSQLSSGDVLVGGMPRRKQMKPKGKGHTRRSGQSSKITKEVSRGAPYAATHECDLFLVEATTLTAVAAYAYKAYHTNDVFDPAITGSGTNIMGKGFLADAYFSFRVLGYSGTVTIINKEAFPIGFYILHTNTNPGSLGSSYITAAGGPFGQSVEVGAATGMSKATLRFSHRITQVVGSQAPLRDDSFAGALASASPTDLTWLAMQVSSLGAGNLSNGVTIILRLKFHVLCYGRLADITTFSKTMHGVPPPDDTVDPHQKVRTDLTNQLAAITAKLSSLDT